MNECSSEDLSLIYVPKKYCRSDLKLLQSYVVLESKGDALAVVPNTSVSHPSEDITPHIIISACGGNICVQRKMRCYR